MHSPGPYRIEGPAIVSFSGGRSSAYMLRQVCISLGLNGATKLFSGSRSRL